MTPNAIRTGILVIDILHIFLIVTILSVHHSIIHHYRLAIVLGYAMTINNATDTSYNTPRGIIIINDTRNTSNPADLFIKAMSLLPGNTTQLKLENQTPLVAI
jgi:hypothetical protein